MSELHQLRLYHEDIWGLRVALRRPLGSFYVDEPFSNALR